MKISKFRNLTIAAILTITTGVFAGCGGNTSSQSSTSGSLTLAGSTALQPLAEQVGKAYTDKNPNVTINVQGGGSGSGLKLALEGTADIGNSDVLAENKLDESSAKSLVDHKVCAVGFAMVTSKDITVTSLTKQQIKDMFTGKITNWNQVGGPNTPINIVNRSKSSGTRAVFKEKVLGGIDEKEGIGTTQDSSGAAEKAVTSNKGSITYLALSYLTSDVRKNVNVLKLDNIEASKANITTDKYVFWSFEHMYTKGEAKELKKAFIDYMTSNEAKAYVNKLGYIPMSDMKVQK